MINAPSQNTGLAKSRLSCLCTSELNAGISRKTKIIENTNAMSARIIDSKKNCTISCFLSDPNVLRMPTSLALFSERAVERFMKLTQAINNMMMAIMVNILTYSIMPPIFLPSLKSLYKCHLLIGKVKYVLILSWLC